MRVKLAHGVVVAATLFGLTGCHLGPGGSGRTWYGAKTKPATPAYSNAPAGPQLPSAAFNTPGAGASPAAAVASSVPPGAAAGLPASYGAASNAGGPSGTYGATNSAYSAAGGAAAQSGPYNSVYNQNPASTPVTTAQATYPSTNYPPTGTPADPYAAGSAAGATNYAGAPAGIHTADASSAAGYAGGNMPAAAPPASSQGYQYPDPGRAVDQPGASPYSAGAAAAGGTSAYGAADPASAGAAGAYPTTGAAGAYPTTGGAGAYPTTGAAGAYPPAGAAGAYPPQGAAAAPAAAYPGTGYTGNTSGDVYPQSNYSNSDSTWKPGDTGYTPPGVPPYQSATPAAAPVSSERRDPNWRPGSTSDFNPARGNRNSSGVMSAGYDAPIGAGSAPTTANPYAGGGATAPYGAGSAAAPAASTPAYGTGSVMNTNMGMPR